MRINFKISRYEIIIKMEKDLTDEEIFNLMGKDFFPDLETFKEFN